MPTMTSKFFVINSVNTAWVLNIKCWANIQSCFSIFPWLDAPKHTHITREAEQQNTEGRSFVKLTCNSQSFPPVKKYEWYQKAKRGDIRLTDGQTYNVYSDAPGMYYCVAKHEISDRLSDPVELFADRKWSHWCVLLYVFCEIKHFILSRLELCHLITNLFCTLSLHIHRRLYEGLKVHPPCSAHLSFHFLNFLYL